MPKPGRPRRPPAIPHWVTEYAANGERADPRASTNPGGEPSIARNVIVARTTSEAGLLSGSSHTRFHEA
jgi:hypothetical protein